MRTATTLVLLSCATASWATPPASPLLAPDHWAVRAAERLHELGLTPEWLPAQRAVPVLAVADALARGAARAGEEAPWAAPMAAAWLARFREEVHASRAVTDGGAAAREGFGPALIAAEIGAGYRGGSVTEVVPPGPLPPAWIPLAAPSSEPFAEVAASGGLGSHLAAGVRLRGTPSRGDVVGGELVAALGPVALSVGRGPVRYGFNDVGGVVAASTAALDRVELMTTEPVRLPWVLGALGEFALDLALVRLDEARHPYDPLLWFMQLQWRPHPRLTLAALRGVMLGGTPWEGISWTRIPLSVFGIQNYKENNVYSGAVLLRLPTEGVLPLTAKLEWGTDDEPAAAWRWPGLVVGLDAPLLGPLPASLGFEYAYLGKGPIGDHDPFGWYSHGIYVGGWATGSTPLGDPMGGNGRAFRVMGSAEPFDARLRVTFVAWAQDRFADNLYGPGATGVSAGGDLGVEVRWGRLALLARALHERGREGWRRTEVRAGVSAFY